MKNAILTLAFLIGGTLIGNEAVTARAAAGRKQSPRLLRCRVYWTSFEQPFEEGLGVFGHEDTDSDSGEVIFEGSTQDPERIQIGQMGFKRKNITVTEGNRFTKYSIVDGDRIHVRLYPSKRGIVLEEIQKKKSKSEFRPMAKFDCSDVRKVLDVKVASSDATLLSEDDISEIDESILKNMALVNEGQERGDDHYVVKKEELYQVSEDDEVIGYVRHRTLQPDSDTEDIHVTTRFDRNGIRLDWPR